MANFKTRIASAFATATLLSTAFTPAAFAQTTVDVTGGGAFSNTTATVNNTSTTTVNQTNNAAVVNLVLIGQNTGRNRANFNTGSGNVSIDTGNANATVNQTTTLGSNNVTGCGCGNTTSNVTANVTGGGAFSNTTANVTSSKRTTVNQTNNLFVLNGAGVLQNTGRNRANFNTGGGSKSIRTGNATANVTQNTTAGSNVLNP